MPVEAVNRFRLERHAAPPPAAVAPYEPPGALPVLPSDVAALPLADVRALTDSLFGRLRGLEEGTGEYSYVRNTLVELNMGLVRHAASRFAHRGEPMDDIVQVGVVGLIKAINRFEPERGLEFVTFALPTVLGEIRRHFRDTSWAVHVPRRLQELRLRLARARDVLQQELDRDPTTAELAAHLDISPAEVVEGQLAANAYSVGTLEAPGDDPDDRSRHDRLGQPEPELEKIETVLSLKRAVAELSVRDRTVLRLRYTEELTQAQIGDRIGLSQMQVSRILTRILAVLRDELS